MVKKRDEQLRVLEEENRMQLEVLLSKEEGQRLEVRTDLFNYSDSLRDHEKRKKEDKEPADW